MDFNYLLGQAKIESGLNANARAGTSSASGLYQFVEQSWLAVVKKHGAEHGMGWAAEQHRPVARPLTVGDPAHPLGDPRAAQRSHRRLADGRRARLRQQGRAGGHAGSLRDRHRPLYGAFPRPRRRQANSCRRCRATPARPRASLFPAAAGANRSIFYAGNGQPRSLAAIYDRFADKLGAASDSATETRNANLAFAAQSLDMDGSTVVTGGNESAEDALAWATQAMGRIRGRLNAESASANACCARRRRTRGSPI